MNDHSEDSCGVSMIFAPPRGVTEETIKDYLALALQLTEAVKCDPFLFKNTIMKISWGSILDSLLDLTWLGRKILEDL